MRKLDMTKYTKQARIDDPTNKWIIIGSSIVIAALFSLNIVMWVTESIKKNEQKKHELYTKLRHEKRSAQELDSLIRVYEIKKDHLATNYQQHLADMHSQGIYVDSTWFLKKEAKKLQTVSDHLEELCEKKAIFAHQK